MNFTERIRIAKESRPLPSIGEIEAQQQAELMAQKLRAQQQAERERERAEEVRQMLRLVSAKFFALRPLPSVDRRALLGRKEYLDFDSMRRTRPTGFLSNAHYRVPPKQWQLELHEEKLVEYLERHSKLMRDMCAKVLYPPDREGEGGGRGRMYLTEEGSVAIFTYTGTVRRGITDASPIVHKPDEHDNDFLLKGHEEEVLDGLARFVVDRGLEL